MNLSLQDKPRSNQMADSWFPTAVISHFYSAVYLQFCNRMLEKILPTPRKISKAISECKTVKELKEFIPGRGAGTLLVDGTHIPVRRSGDKERRKETYSGKKKRHTFNTTSVRYK